MQMDPGAETTEHTHAHREEFMILQGDLIENDGTVLGPGDYVCFAPGTRHNSRTKDGCLLIVFEWKN
ncbi:MAG: cupin domain-containing protein [Acidiferrobacterales bacterium]